MTDELQQVEDTSTEKQVETVGGVDIPDTTPEDASENEGK